MRNQHRLGKGSVFSRNVWYERVLYRSKKIKVEKMLLKNDNSYHMYGAKRRKLPRGLKSWYIKKEIFKVINLYGTKKRKSLLVKKCYLLFGDIELPTTFFLEFAVHKFSFLNLLKYACCLLLYIKFFLDSVFIGVKKYKQWL